MERQGREKVFMDIDLGSRLDRLKPGPWKNIIKVRLYVTNLMNRRLEVKDIMTLAQSMYGLKSRLSGQPELPFFTIIGLLPQLVRSTLRYLVEDTENFGDCPALTEPRRIMMTPVTERPPPGTMLSPVHPMRTSIAALKGDPRNDVKKMTWSPRHFYRVVCPMYYPNEEEMPGCVRVSDYTEDGQMILSVMCSFPGVKRLHRELEQLHAKRKRDESGDGARTRKRLRL